MIYAPQIKSVLITGASSGLGLEHCRAFAARGLQVFATARVPAQAEELRSLAQRYEGRITVLAYDAAQADAAQRLKRELGDLPIDLLLANAGAIGGERQSFGAVDVAAALQLVQVNALAPLQLVEALADNVAVSGRKLIAFQSSKMGSIGDNSSGGYYAYRVSKAALNMIAKCLCSDLGPRGVTVVSLHPGWVQTRMGGANAPVTVQQSVAGQQLLLDRLTPQDSGRFFNYDGAQLPW